jgi:hypothetical protein
LKEEGKGGGDLEDYFTASGERVERCFDAQCLAVFSQLNYFRASLSLLLRLRKVSGKPWNYLIQRHEKCACWKNLIA